MRQTPRMETADPGAGHVVYGPPAEAFLFAPPAPALLVLTFPREGRLFVRENPAVRLLPLAWEGLSIDRGLLGQTVEAEAGAGGLFAADLSVRRGPLDPARCRLTAADRRRWADRLGENDHLDFRRACVAAATAEIEAGIAAASRDDAHATVEAVRDWMRRNVRYTLLPASAVRRIEAVVSELPPEERRDPRAVLRRVLDVSDGFLARLCRDATVPASLPPAEAARALVAQLDRNLLQILWLGDGLSGEELSASRTLENGGGKCVGITNLFVALLRALRVPAVAVPGFHLSAAGEGAGHAWAIAYLGDEGWRECDPTMDEFARFAYARHGYPFSGAGTTALPEAQYVRAGMDPRVLARCRRILSARTSLLERLLRARRAKALALVERLSSAAAPA